MSPAEKTPVDYNDDPEQVARTFIAGTARVFTIAGAALLLSSCCLGMFGRGLIQPGQTPDNSLSLLDYFVGERLPATVMSIGLAVAVIGSLGMIASGMALSGELRRSGMLAMAVSGAVTLPWVVTSLILLMCPGHRLAAIPFALLAVGGTVLLLLAAHSSALLQDYPPMDRDQATQEALKAYQRRKELNRRF